MKREVLKKYLIITFFFFLLVFAYYIYKERDNPVKEDYVTFSKDSGFYDETISVRLSKNVDLPLGTELFYTLNGNDPTIESTKYTGAIKLEMVEDETKVYPLKVVAYHNDKYSDIVQKTYVIDNRIDSNNIKIISVVSDEKHLYDYEKGILVPGKTYDDNVKKGRTGYIPGNYNNEGDEWEKPANITIFDINGKIEYDALSGIIPSGSAGASLPIKSLKVIANKFDSDNKIIMDAKGEQDWANTSFVNEYNSIRIRSGSSDQKSANIRSSVASRLVTQSGYDSMTTTERAAVFLNGEFYGVFDIQQNYSNSFIKNKFKLDDSNKISKMKGSEKKFHFVFEDYNKSKDIKDLEDKIDMDNYIFYYALEILLNNTDWPSNNFEAWKYKGDYDKNNKYTDGRYRFMIYDTDWMYLDNKDTFARLMLGLSGGKDSYFKNIMNIKYYRDKYVMLTQDLLNTTFKESNILKIVEEEYEKVEYSYFKYYSEEDYDNFIKSVNELKSAVKKRDNVLIGDFDKYFGLSKKHIVTVKTKDGMQVNFSNQELYQNKTYSNNYYTGIDLRYNYVEYPGYKFSHWLVNGKKITDKELVIKSDDYKNVDKIDIEIVANYIKEDNHLLISEVYANGDSDWIRIANIGKDTIDLKGYFLTDREKKLYKYELPNIMLDSNESIIINGDKNYYSVGDYICNFSLKKGETIFLSKDGVILDTFTIPKMSDIESYGRYDNSNTFKYFYNKNNERKKD